MTKKVPHIVLRDGIPRPPVGTIQYVEEAILDALAQHCVAEDKANLSSLSDRRVTFKQIHASKVRQLVDETFRKRNPDARTPAQLLFHVGRLCEQWRLPPLETGAEELLEKLNELLRGGGRPMQVP